MIVGIIILFTQPSVSPSGLLAQLGELGWKDDGSEDGMEGADDAQAVRLLQHV